MKHLLERLYGLPISKPSTLGENFVRLFEDAAEAESEYFKVADKKPLSKILKRLGVSFEGQAEADVSLVTIRFTDDQEYRDACAAIFTADAMHELAEAGWVAEKCGDAGMSNEAPDYHINFVEIPDMPANDKDTAPSLKNIMKDGRKNATTMQKRDDKLNPVESDPKAKMGDKQKGIGKAKDGSGPTGKPKGSTKSESVDDILPAPPLQEMTSVSAIPAVEAPMGIAKRRRKRNTGRDAKSK